ncbi:MAG TPA: DUF721 domain-containing protein [Acetobacteraceae bacterium]|nr:DUF721 domain-containing protein [Acetobacteraceae bacterium]
MATAPRHVYGPRPLGALVPSVARPAFRKMGPGAGQVMADWDAIVGPMLAAVSAPRRLAAGTLTVACTGPVAMELQHYATELISRINTHLGTPAVRQLRFVQTIALAPQAPPPPPPMPPWVAAAAETAVAALPEGELRVALAALGRAVLAGEARGEPSTNPTPRH